MGWGWYWGGGIVVILGLIRDLWQNLEVPDQVRDDVSKYCHPELGARHPNQGLSNLLEVPDQVRDESVVSLWMKKRERVRMVIEEIMTACQP